MRVVGGGFAVDQHGYRDDSPFVVSARSSGSEPASPLALVADPVEPAPGATEAALDIVTGMDVYLQQTLDHGVQRALTAAFATANERVYAANAARHGMRRIYLGLTCVVLDESALYVAQVSPSQVLVWQDGSVYAVPSLRTWWADEITETFSDLSYPLGFRESIEPRISFSHCEPGDVIAVVSWPLARQLGTLDSLDGVRCAGDFVNLVSRLNLEAPDRRYHGAVFELHATGVPGRQVATGRAVRSQFLDSIRIPLDSQPANSDSSATRQTHSGTTGLRRTDDTTGIVHDWDPNGSGAEPLFDTLEFEQFRWAETDTFPTIEIGDGDDTHDDFFDLAAPPQRFSAPRHGIVNENELGRRAAARRTRKRVAKPARKGRRVEIFAGLLLSLTAAVVGAWQVTKRDRPIHGPRDDGTLGLPHLQRWSDTYQPPRFEGLRRVSPRFQLSGIAMIAVGLIVVALLGALVYGYLGDRVEQRTASIDDRLQEIAAVREQAAASEDNQAAYASLIEAESVLDTMATTVTGDKLLARIGDEQQAVSQTLDALTAVERLTSVQTMGSVPVAPEGVTPSLFTGNGNVYILSGGLYELDKTTGSLIQLLGAGDDVDGAPVGTLLAADWAQDRPLVVDSHNAFTLDPSTGEWDRKPLGTLSQEGYLDVAAIAAFDRNLYMLTPDSGQILKFDALDFGEEPEDWTAGVAKEELKGGVDLVVDGSIHVALTDGQVLSFFRSSLENTVTAGVAPPVSEVSALIMANEGQVFYLIDQLDGRIICVDREGNVLRQFIVAAGAPPLIGATDIVVDESSGIAHVIANNTLYAVRLDMPPP